MGLGDGEAGEGGRGGLTMDGSADDSIGFHGTKAPHNLPPHGAQARGHAGVQRTSGPTQSERKVTSLPRSSWRRTATFASDIDGTTSPCTTAQHNMRRRDRHGIMEIMDGRVMVGKQDESGGKIVSVCAIWRKKWKR